MLDVGIGLILNALQAIMKVRAAGRASNDRNRGGMCRGWGHSLDITQVGGLRETREIAWEARAACRLSMKASGNIVQAQNTLPRGNACSQLSVMQPAQPAQGAQLASRCS